MTPVGNTNQAIGLQVGRQSLTAAPFTIPTVDTDCKYQTVIILLTYLLTSADQMTATFNAIGTN